MFKQNNHKKNTLMAISFIFLLSSVLFFMTVFSLFQLTNKNDQTQVGFIYLGDLQIKQYPQRLLSQMGTWKENTHYQIEYQNVTHVIDLSMFEFDLDKTLNEINQNENNKAYFKLSMNQKQTLHYQLVDAFGVFIMTGFNIEDFISDVMKNMETLKPSATFRFEEYMDITHASTLLSTSTVSLVPIDIKNNILQMNIEIKIAPLSRFSLLKALSPYSLSNEALSIIASGILGLLPQTHVTGILFESNPVFPIWAKPGQNVRILTVNQFDLTFFNDLNLEYKIMIKSTFDGLSFEFLGYPYLCMHQSYIEHIYQIPIGTVLVYDESLDIFQPNITILSEDEDFITFGLLSGLGQEGVMIHTYRTTSCNNQEETRLLFYEIIESKPDIYRYIIIPKESN